MGNPHKNGLSQQFFADIKGVGYYPSAQKVGWGETIKVLDKKTRIEVSELETEVKNKQSEEDQKLINQKIEGLKKKSREMLATVSVKPRMTRVLPRGDWMDQTGNRGCFQSKRGYGRF